MSSDTALMNWLLDLKKHGFVLLQSVPIEEGHVPSLLDRVAFQKLTHYG